jgi:hypothetical protein
VGHFKQKFVRLLIISFTTLSVPVAVFLVTKGITFFSRASGTNADLVVDVAVSEPAAFDSWKGLAQGGEESARMLSPVISQTRQLAPEYIRIDHIYDFYGVVNKGPSGNLVFDWTKLDQTVSDILNIGAKPFFSLSYMPSAISSGSETDLPQSWDAWQLLVRQTIEHYSGKSGLAIPGVYYEVWNEPDLFGDFKLYGSKNYLTLYYHTATAAAKAQNTLPFKIGGPATTSFYRNWFNDFFDFIRSNSLRVDFYSWHRYSKNPLDYEMDLAFVRTWLIEHYPEYQAIDLIISEVGPNSDVDPDYDSVSGAIHALALASIAEKENLRLFNFEIKDGPGPSQYWGRWGILTHEKFGAPVEKPRYQALSFLNRMQGDRINTRGDGTWVKAFARKDASVLRLLVVNYDSQSKHSEAVPITFNNLTSPNFIFKRIDFLGGERQINVATTSATWSRQEYFKPNSAAIFELIPTQ